MAIESKRPATAHIPLKVHRGESAVARRSSSGSARRNCSVGCRRSIHKTRQSHPTPRLVCEIDPRQMVQLRHCVCSAAFDRVISLEPDTQCGYPFDQSGPTACDTKPRTNARASLWEDLGDRCRRRGDGRAPSIIGIGLWYHYVTGAFFILAHGDPGVAQRLPPGARQLGHQHGRDRPARQRLRCQRRR